MTMAVLQGLGEKVDPWLSSEARDFEAEDFGPAALSLYSILYDVMRENRGAGISACQISLQAVERIRALHANDKILSTDKPMNMCLIGTDHPRVLERHSQLPLLRHPIGVCNMKIEPYLVDEMGGQYRWTRYNEKCLSFAGHVLLSDEEEYPPVVLIKGFDVWGKPLMGVDEKGDEIEGIILGGTLAIVAWHEASHLRGELLNDVGRSDGVLIDTEVMVEEHPEEAALYQANLEVMRETQRVYGKYTPQRFLAKEEGEKK